MKKRTVAERTASLWFSTAVWRWCTVCSRGDSSLASKLTLVSSATFRFSELFPTLLRPSLPQRQVARNDFSVFSVDWLLSFELFPADIPYRCLQRPDQWQWPLAPYSCIGKSSGLSHALFSPVVLWLQHPQNHRVGLRDAGGSTCGFWHSNFEMMLWNLHF